MAKEYDEILLRIPSDSPILKLIDEKRGELSREDFILTIIHIVCEFTEKDCQGRESLDNCNSIFFCKT